MGYSFELADATASYSLNIWQMTHVRLVLLESGAAAGDGMERIFGNDRFAPAPQTVPLDWYGSNSGRHVPAPACEFLATRLRAALSADLIGDMAMFYPDQPTQLPDWIAEFATFHETATAHGGYHIR